MAVDAGRLLLLDGQRWSTLLVVISLDIVQPHYDRIRLHVPSGFVSVVRDVILRRASLERQLPFKLSYFVPDTLGTIARTLGEDTCVRFIRWGRTIFTYTRAEYPTLGRWCMVLAAAAGDGARWRSLRLPPGLSEEARRRFAAAEEIPADDMVADLSRGQPLSDWDVCFYALRGFDDEDRSEEANAPSRWVRDTARTARRLEYWRWLLSRLGAEGQRVLQASAAAFAGDEPLRHPQLIGIDDE